MLAVFRRIAKSWVARILLGLLIVSFAIWGVNDAFKAKISNDVVVAGKHKVSQEEFKRIFENALRQISQEQNQVLTNEQAVAGGLDRQILDDLVNGETLWELIRRIGVRPSDKLLGQKIQTMSGLFDPVTGKFSQDNYQRLLNDNKLTVDQFEALMGDQIAEQQFGAGVNAGLKPPTIYAATLTAFTLESRGAKVFAINPGSLPQPPAPTDAQLQKFINDNAARLRRPEFRTISLVRLSTAALAPTLPVDQVEVQKRYDAAKGRLSVPEKRSFIQIPAQTMQMAAAIAARVARGEDPAAVARAAGVQPLVYADTQKSSVPDPRVGDAAFALQAGQSSPAIRGQFGFAVVKVTKITPPKLATLEEARPDIVKQMQQAAAEERIFAQVQKFDDAHSGGASLSAAAQAVGVKVYVLGPLTAQGQDTSGRQVVGLTPQMLRDAFSTPQGGESDSLVDIGKGEYYALRVDKITPAAVPPLAEIRGPLAKAWVSQEMLKRMKARGEELAARVRKGEAIETVAAAAGSKLSHPEGVSRATAQRYAPLGRDLLGKLFAAKKGEVFVAEHPQLGILVAQADPPKAADPNLTAMLAQAQAQGLNAQLFREMTEMTGQYARQHVKWRMNRDKALQAIGVKPDEVPAGPAAPAS